MGENKELTADEFLRSVSEQETKFYVEALDGLVTVRPLTYEELAQITTASQEREDEQGTYFKTQLLLTGLVSPTLSEDHAERLRMMHGGAFAEVVHRIMELSTLTMKETAPAVKSFRAERQGRTRRQPGASTA